MTLSLKLQEMKWDAIREGHEEGMAQGLAQGLEEGRQQGIEQGRAEQLAADQAEIAALKARIEQLQLSINN